MLGFSLVSGKLKENNLAFLELRCEAFLEVGLEIQCILGTLAFLRLARMAVGIATLVEHSKQVVAPHILVIFELASLEEHIIELEVHNIELEVRIVELEKVQHIS